MALDTNAILEARSAAAMASAHMDTIREKTSGAFWVAGARDHLAAALVRDAERAVAEAERELANAKDALARARAEQAEAA